MDFDMKPGERLEVCERYVAVREKNDKVRIYNLEGKFLGRVDLSTLLLIPILSLKSTRPKNFLLSYNSYFVIFSLTATYLHILPTVLLFHIKSFSSFNKFFLSLFLY